MMSERFKIKILFFLTTWLILNVDTKRTSADLSEFEEDTPLKMFWKDEPMRQDANEKISKAIHLCIEEKFQNEQLITCDRRYSSQFACVGSWEGVLQKCDTFGEGTLAAPICVLENSSFVVICEYENFKTSGLCSPKKALKNDNREIGKYVKFTEGFRENIRACKKSDQRMKRLCLHKGILIHCSENRPESLISNHSSIMTDDKVRNKPDITYEKVSSLSRQRDMLQFQNHKESLAALKLSKNKTEPVSSKMKSQFRSTGQEKPYDTSVNTNTNKNYPAFKYNDGSKMLPQRGISDYSNINDYSSEITSNSNKSLTNPINTEFAPDAKESNSNPTKFRIDQAYPLEEIELFLNRFEKSVELTTVHFDQQRKFRVPRTRQSQRSGEELGIDQLDSKHGETARSNLKWRLNDSEIVPKITERPEYTDKRLMEAETIIENSKRAKMLELLYRAPWKPRRKRPSRIPNNSKGQNMFFHVLKCKDCDIKHDMIVDKNAKDVIPEVETWTFKL